MEQVGPGPFIAEVAYGFGEVPGDTSANRNIGAMFGYRKGPLDVRFGYHRNNSADGTDNGRSAMIGGTYDFNVLKAHLGVQSNEGLVIINGRPIADTDTRDLVIGVTVPFGVNSLLATYTHKDDRGTPDTDARQLAIGISHRLSKRTDLYASVARIKNDAPVGSSRFYTVGNGSSQGTGDKAFNFGVRHVF